MDLTGINVSLRPIGPGDMGFLLELYASTRAAELAQVPWTPQQKEAFVQMQFNAQHAHYMEHFGGDSLDVLLDEGGTPIGRLYVGRWADEIRVIDITLAPERRGQGLGERLMRALQAEASACGKPLRIHVVQFNPAMRLYLRLGFESIEDKGVYRLMEWSCQPKTAS